MKPATLLALVLAAWVSAPALGQAQPAQPRPRPAAAPAARPARAPAAPRLPVVETWKLDNGLEVAHAALPGSPVVSVQVWYRVGAVDDPAGKRGLARLFEELMFAGSARLRPGDHRAYLERVGGTTTAQVSEDVSAFGNTVPAERLELALDLELDRMRGLELDEEAVGRAVELAQRAQARQAQSPLWRGYRALLATAYVQHPYGKAAAAPAAELAGIQLADARAFYDAYYQPSNALLVVVGGVERDTVRDAVAARFASIPAAAAPPRPAAELPEPPQSANRRAELPGAPGVVLFGVHVPAAREPAVYAYQLLGQVLTGGKASRLGALIAKRQASDVGGQVLVRRDPGLMLFYAGAARGVDAEALEAAIAAELAALARRGPTAAELARAKKQIVATVLGAAQSASGYANQLGVAWALTGEPAAIAADLADLEAVPLAAVKRAAAEALRSDRTTVVIGTAGAATGGRR